MNAISLALDDVKYAFRHLEFAIKLLCHCELDHLDRAQFDADVTVRLDPKSVSFPVGTFQSLDSVVLASQALVGVCFGVSAIVLDAAFEVASIQRRPTSREQADELRTLVYMVRCAFGHNPANPRWAARGSDFRRELSLGVGERQLAIDLASLDGVVFDYSHIGGFANWYEIGSASVALIRSASANHQEG